MLHIGHYQQAKVIIYMDDDISSANELEPTLCVLSAEALAAFESAINADAQIIPAIAALLTHKAPWDND